jgi:hypothetical protein
MSKALILGCSHAAGAEMHPDPNVAKQLSYPAKISSGLGYTIENCSISGGSNDAMFRIFEEHCSKLHNDDIVVACWTGSERMEIFHEQKQQWLPVVHKTPTNYDELYQDYCKQWTALDTWHWKWRLNKIKNIISLNTVAHALNIKVYNIDSFNIVQGFNTFDLYKHFNWPVESICFTNWCLEKKFAHTLGGHFFEDAHQAFADLVVSHIKKIVDA